MAATRTVLVVGAGIAGLGAAYALKKRGYAVRVLEAGGIPGGRMACSVEKGFTLDHGAQFLAGRGAYRHLWRLMDELGLSATCRPIGVQANALVRDGRFYDGKWTDPARLVATGYLSTGAKFSLTRLLPQVMLGLLQLEPMHPELAHHLDTEDARTWACRTVGEEVADYVFGPAFGATFDTDLSHLSRAFVLNSLVFMSKGFAVHSPEGGPGAVTRALAQRLDVTYRTKVTGFQANERTVTLTRMDDDGGEHTEEADGLVLAIPAPALRDIAGGLNATEQLFLDQVRYTRGIIVTFALENRPPTIGDVYGIGMPAPEGFGIYGAAVDHQKGYAAPQGKGLLNCALTETEAAARWEHDDKTIAAFARHELERSPVGPLGKALQTRVDRWRDLLPCFYPGYHKRLGDFMHRGEVTHRIALAGDYLVGPFTEAAYVSGLRAALKLHFDLVREHHWHTEEH